MIVTEEILTKTIYVVGILHLILALLAMVELKFIPFYKFLGKSFWFVFIWALPILGTLMFHSIAKTGWDKIEISK